MVKSWVSTPTAFSVWICTSWPSSCPLTGVRATTPAALTVMPAGPETSEKLMGAVPLASTVLSAS